MMRDNIKLYENFSSFSHSCPLCSKSGHFFQNCSKLHHIPDKKFLISRLTHFKQQTREKTLKRRKLKKSNFRKIFLKINETALKYKKINVEDSLSEFKEEESKESDTPLKIEEDLLHEKKLSFPSMEIPQDGQKIQDYPNFLLV